MLILTSLFFVAAVLVSYIWRDLYYLDAYFLLFRSFICISHVYRRQFLHPAFHTHNQLCFFGSSSP
jgi:hypothetical protein